jgi:hypothetical protein
MERSPSAVACGHQNAASGPTDHASEYINSIEENSSVLTA